jgi:putative SOS response-associated peptidase YedK
MRWGFVPTWAKEEPKDFLRTRMTYNCVSEEVAEKPVFRNAFKHGHRCLVPVTGFYEHHHVGKGAKAVKIPYLIQVQSEPVFCLGGLFERDTFTLFTTRPNAAIARIHNSKDRQVLIIPKEHEEDWLNPDLTLEEVNRFFTPFPEEDMKWHTISKRITQRGFDPNIEEINDPVDYPEFAGMIP